MTPVTREQLRGLLLHRLTEDERQRLHEVLAGDESVAEMLRREEADLVDDYAFGHLGVEDREAFERHLFVDSAIRERVRVARALQNVAVELQSKVSVWDRWPTRAAVALVACIFAIPLFTRMNRDASVAPLSAAKASPAKPAAGKAEFTTRIVLLTDLEHAGEARVVRVAIGAPGIQLVAEATSSDPSVFYELRVEDESGAWIFSAEDLRPVERQGRVFVEVSIPANASLGTGRRVVTLQPQTPGVESFMWRMDVQPAG